jgi:hypothetical protein
MTSDNGIHVGKPPFFDGNNYDYWKTRMSDPGPRGCVH